MMQLRHRTLLVMLVLAVVAGVALGTFAAGSADGMVRRVGGRRVDGPSVPGHMQLTTGSFPKVADLVKPAVININTVSKGGPPGRTPFEEFFGEEFYRRFFGEAPERIPQRSLGSGVIIDSGGVALTNAHVVERATEIEIITLDGSKHKAKVVGLDKKTDLAVLRLDDGKGKFPSIRLGDSDKMQVGDWVIAVGSPFGLQATVTAGILSAQARPNGPGPVRH